MWENGVSRKKETSENSSSSITMTKSITRRKKVGECEQKGGKMSMKRRSRMTGWRWNEETFLCLLIQNSSSHLPLFSTCSTDRKAFVISFLSFLTTPLLLSIAFVPFCLLLTIITTQRRFFSLLVGAGGLDENHKSFFSYALTETEKIPLHSHKENWQYSFKADSPQPANCVHTDEKTGKSDTPAFWPLSPHPTEKNSLFSLNRFDLMKYQGLELV